MASKTSEPLPAPGEEGVPLRLSDLAEAIIRRRAESAVDTTPRNAGNRRTASKRALLKAIGDMGGRW